MLESRIDNFQVTTSNSISHDKETFAGIVAESLKSPLTQTSILPANEYALKVNERKNSVILKNTQLPENSERDLKLCTELSGNCRLEVPVSEKC